VVSQIEGFSCLHYTTINADLQLRAVICFYKPGESQASPVWHLNGAGGAVLSELEVLRVRRCSL